MNNSPDNKRKGLQLWQVILDCLTNIVFEPYVYWTGRGSEFVIVNKELLFTEYHYRKKGEPPTRNMDPLVRWKGQIIGSELLEVYQKEMEEECFPGGFKQMRPFEQRKQSQSQGFKSMPVEANHEASSSSQHESKQPVSENTNDQHTTI